jgi:hypothetical protein
MEKDDLKTTIAEQLEAARAFNKAIREDTEELGEKFDETLADRPRFREVDFSELANEGANEN